MVAPLLTLVPCTELLLWFCCKTVASLVTEFLVPVAPLPPEMVLDPETAPLIVLTPDNLVEEEFGFLPNTWPLKPPDPERLPILLFIPYLTALDSPRLPVWFCLPV
jgi:hypothetical protein